MSSRLTDSTGTKVPTRPRVSLVQSGYGDSVDTHHTLGRLCCTGVSGPCAVRLSRVKSADRSLARHRGESRSKFSRCLVRLSRRSNLHHPPVSDLLLGSLTPSLLFLSGIPTAQKPAAKKYYLQSHEPSNSESFSTPAAKNDTWQKYKDYLVKTSVIIPCPPSIYRPLPGFIKNTLFLDLPMYRFDEETDGKEALEEERKKREHEV